MDKCRVESPIEQKNNQNKSADEGRSVLNNNQSKSKSTGQDVSYIYIYMKNLKYFTST